MPVDDGIERVASGTGERQEHGRGQETQSELVAVRHEQSCATVHEENRARHSQRQAERGEPRQQTNDERDAAAELQQRHCRTDQPRHRDAHRTKRTGDAFKPVYEQLLRAMRDEDRPDDGSKKRQSDVQLSG